MISIDTSRVIDDSCCVRFIFPNPFLFKIRRRGTRGIARRASSVFLQPMLSHQAVVFRIRVSFSLMRFHGS